MRTLVRLIGGILVGIGFVALVAVGLFLSSGISARQEPSGLEASIAPRLRSMAIPREAREKRSPVPASADAVKEGMEHFADHCALCHGNDGSGDTHMGRNLYPRVPDMRKAETQNLTDGELFYIIENGVKLTGMPAWAGAEEHGANTDWNLVQFIRHLPKLTPAEEARMRELNPKAPDEMPGNKQGQEAGAGHKHDAGAKPHKHGG
jgi:mono/diheme cytochrome c family protein